MTYRFCLFLFLVLLCRAALAEEEPVFIRDGTVILDKPRYTNQLTMAGGTLVAETDVVVLEKPLMVADDGVARIQIGSRDVLTLEGGIAGTGDLSIGGLGEVRIDGPLELDGTLELDSNRGSFGTYQGRLSINVDVSGRLDLHRGGLVVDPDHTFTSLDPDLEMRGAYLNGRLAGVDTLRKAGWVAGTVTSIGADNEAAVIVEQGRLAVRGEFGLGSPTVGTSIGALRDAAIVITGAATSKEPIHLNNGTGFDYGGALLFEPSTSTSVYAGRLDLGQVGAVIGLEDGRGDAALSGPISGGSLIFSPLSGGSSGATLRITSDANTYTGQTVLGLGENRPGTFAISDAGRLTTTQGVAVNHRVDFVLDNSHSQIHADRLADHIPATMRGGTLTLRGSWESGTEIAETIGSVTFEIGHSTIALDDIHSQAINLTMGSLHRRPGATAEFSLGTSDPNGSVDYAFHVDSQPELTGGILGGWAFVSAKPLQRGLAVDFATYDPEQGIQLLDLVNRPKDLASAGPSGNVWLDRTPPTLTADTTVNSLLIERAESESVSIDLNGKTLNLVTGGLLSDGGQFANLISNGNLTAGGDGADGELVMAFGSGGTFHIDADIVDNPQGAVGVTFARYGQWYLGGNNTYSGPTVINGTLVALESDHAIPSGNDVIVHGGTLSIEFSPSAPIKLGTLTIRQSGTVGPAWGIKDVQIEADEYLVEQGSLSDIKGSGRLLKTAPGSFSMYGDNHEYYGEIVVEEGLLKQWGNSLGHGPITIRAAGTLESRGLSNEITLDGGVLNLGTINPQGSLIVAQDSQLHVSGAGSLKGILAGNGDLWIRDKGDQLGFGSLYVSGDASAYTGVMHVENVHLEARSAGALGINGAVVYRDGMLIADTPMVTGNIELRGGSLSAQGEPRAFSGAITVTSDSTIRAETDIQLLTDLSLADGVTLTKTDEGSLTISSSLRVGEDTRLRIDDGIVSVDARIRSNATNAHLDFIGYGEFELNESLLVEDGQSLTITSNGTALPLVIDGLGKTVSGSGTLGNDLQLGPDARLRPGRPFGVFTVDGNYAQDADAVLEIDLAKSGSVAGKGFDHVRILGQATLAGAIRLAIGDDYQLAAGTQESLAILSADQGIIGAFEDTPERHQGSGLFVDVRHGANHVLLDVMQAVAGDANGDGQFNQLDLVEVLAADKYMANEPADWTEGDWAGGIGSGDGVFNQLDIVAALAGGSFLAGPLASTSAIVDTMPVHAPVPEPSTLCLLVMGLVAVMSRTRRRAAAQPATRRVAPH